MKGLFERMNVMPEDGDLIGACCVNCGCRYPHHVGVDKDRTMKRCPGCHNSFMIMWKTSVTGSLRINDKTVRDIIAKAIDEHTPYKTFVEERVGDIWVYNPQSSEGKANAIK